MNLNDIKVGDKVLINPKHVFWDVNLDEYCFDPKSWGVTGWDLKFDLEDEWFEVAHTYFDKQHLNINPYHQISFMGRLFFLAVEIPKTSKYYHVYEDTFDLNKKIYNQDPITYYGFSSDLHGKKIVDVWEKFIKDVKSK